MLLFVYLMLARVFVHSAPNLGLVWLFGWLHDCDNTFYWIYRRLPQTTYQPLVCVLLWIDWSFAVFPHVSYHVTMLLRHVPQFLRTRFSSAPRNAEEQCHTWSRFFSMAAEVVFHCFPALSDGEDMHESQGNLGLRNSTHHDVHSIFPEVPQNPSVVAQFQRR